MKKKIKETSWQYYRKGKLVKEFPNNIHETIEDAVIELQENGIDVSDCISDNKQEKREFLDNTEEDYSIIVENCEPVTGGIFRPLSKEEEEQYKKAIDIMKDTINSPKVSDDFIDKLHKKIKKHGRPSRIQRLSNWWSKWTTGEKVYVSFWIITFYILIGLVQQDINIIRVFCEIFLWPFFL